MTVPTLTGSMVTLRPMALSDAQAMVSAASDGQLWTLPYTVVPSAETIQAYLAKALAGRDAGTVWPFVVVARTTQAVIGSTRFWKMDRDQSRRKDSRASLNAARATRSTRAARHSP
jgi:N-acetyltransferase